MSLWMAGILPVDTRPILTSRTIVGYLQLPLATCSHPTPREPENGDRAGLRPATATTATTTMPVPYILPPTLQLLPFLPGRLVIISKNGKKLSLFTGIVPGAGLHLHNKHDTATGRNI